MEREGSGVSSEVLCSVLMELCEYQQREIARLLLLTDGSQDTVESRDPEPALSYSEACAREIDRLLAQLAPLHAALQQIPWVRVKFSVSHWPHLGGGD